MWVSGEGGLEKSPVKAGRPCVERSLVLNSRISGFLLFTPLLLLVPLNKESPFGKAVGVKGSGDSGRASLPTPLFLSLQELTGLKVRLSVGLGGVRAEQAGGLESPRGCGALVAQLSLLT